MLTQNHSELPVTLVLGMATSAAALTQMLPVAAADMLAPRNFKLVQAMARLEAVVRQVLLGPRPHAVFFGHRLLRALDDDFMLQDFTVGSAERGLQVRRWL